MQIALSPRCEQILDSPAFVRERARSAALTPEQRQAELAEAIAADENEWLADEQRHAANVPIIAASRACRERVRAADKLWLAFCRRRIVVDDKLEAWSAKKPWPKIKEHQMPPKLSIVSSDAAPANNALKLTFFDECRDRAPKRWLHKGVFAKGENSSIFGAPGTLKSALLVDAAVHIAAGKDWRGFKSKERCGVVYFAFERADLVRRRLAAYAMRDGLKDLPIAVAGNLIDMLNSGCVKIVVDTVKAAEARFGIPVAFIVFDTWSKGIAVGGGDEDRARDQNLIAANLRLVHETLDIHIAGVGHSGKDTSRGERGSNARQGDVDLQIQVTGDSVMTATVIKANDQAEGPLMSFAGEVVALGADEDGDPVTAFILSTRNFEPAPKAAAKLSDRQVLALDALRRAIQEHGRNSTVDVDHWREEMFRAGVLDRDAANPRQEFKRLRDTLARFKRIVERDGIVRIGHPAPIDNLTGHLPRSGRSSVAPL